jgi:hypothetical protein
MNILYLESTEDSPEITLNKTAGTFSIAGRSIPEDAIDFYQPILDWFKKYAEFPNSTTTLTLNLTYFNTASSKSIFEILKCMENISGASVIWKYDQNDKSTEEIIREYAELVKVPIQMQAY